VVFSEPGLIARCVNGCFAIGRHRSRRNMRCRRCGGKVLYAPAAGG
jgi:DNA-directed RNA polymerase subunit RPC12/RpoP